jgi:hypothetical protein
MREIISLLLYFISVADPDPGFGIRCLFDPWIRDTGRVKTGPEAGMNNPDHISESLETNFWAKILKLFEADPGWKKVGSGIQDPGWRKFGSGMNIQDPQHWTWEKNSGAGYLVPHLAAISDHIGHAGVHDDVTGHVQVRDALHNTDSLILAESFTHGRRNYKDAKPLNVVFTGV